VTSFCELEFFFFYVNALRLAAYTLRSQPQETLTRGVLARQLKNNPRDESSAKPLTVGNINLVATDELETCLIGEVLTNSQENFRNIEIFLILSVFVKESF